MRESKFKIGDSVKVFLKTNEEYFESAITKPRGYVYGVIYPKKKKMGYCYLLTNSDDYVFFDDEDLKSCRIVLTEKIINFFDEKFIEE